MLTPRAMRLVALLSRFPGVGEKTAQRYVLFLLSVEPELAEHLGDELAHLHERIKPCVSCGNLAEVEEGSEPTCAICTDSKRDSSILCVVAKVHDLAAIERAGTMRGRYFVLGRLLSPLDGVGPEELPLPKLRARIRESGVKEVIVATPPSVDGEATALLLRRELGGLAISLTRIASGVPHGGDLEFADPITISRALAGRQKLG